MRELSLHILDIAQNSLSAGARNIKISVTAQSGMLTIEVSDDGCGMTGEMANSLSDPFVTTRTTRRVGMGVPLFAEAARLTGGDLSVKSRLGEGTVLTADFVLDSLDRAPLGEIADTLVTLISGAPDTDFVYTQSADGNSFVFDTAEVRKMLQEVPLNAPEVSAFLRDFLKDNLSVVKID